MMLVSVNVIVLVSVPLNTWTQMYKFCVCLHKTESALSVRAFERYFCTHTFSKENEMPMSAEVREHYAKYIPAMCCFWEFMSPSSCNFLTANPVFTPSCKRLLLPRKKSQTHPYHNMNKNISNVAIKKTNQVLKENYNIFACIVIFENRILR